MIGAHELSIKADLTYRQVDYWTRTGLLDVLPGNPFCAGSGYPRLYDEYEVRIACLMSRLVKVGLAPLAARAVAEQLDADGMAVLGTFTLAPTREAS